MDRFTKYRVCLFEGAKCIRHWAGQSRDSHVSSQWTTSCSFDLTSGFVKFTSVFSQYHILIRYFTYWIWFYSWYIAGPDGSFVSTGAYTWRYQARIPVRTDIYHRGCAYAVLQTVQRHGVYSDAYGSVHYKKSIKSSEIRVGHSPGFGLPSANIVLEAT